jgi:ectoine hydroxylase-related dioxygenase (phytanoyl-CoA dioxygenase family)
MPVEAKAGSLLFFDSRLYHRAGQNRSARPRRALNFQYTRPFIKQQIDLTALFSGRVERESELGRALGMWAVPPKSVEEFRVEPSRRSYKAGQG